MSNDLNKEKVLNVRLLREREEGTAVPPVMDYIKINTEARALRNEALFQISPPFFSKLRI